MAFSLDSTVGGASANSYASIAYAASYFAARAESSLWTAASSAVRAVALATATAWLDLEEWTGTRSTTTQRLKFPRTSLVDEDGTPWADDALPRWLQDACCELALDVIKNAGTDLYALTGLEQFSSLSLGTIAFTLRSQAPAARRNPVMQRLIQRYLAPGTAYGTFRVMRS